PAGAGASTSSSCPPDGGRRRCRELYRLIFEFGVGGGGARLEPSTGGRTVLGSAPRASAGGGRLSASGARRAPDPRAETADPDGSRRTGTRSSALSKRRLTSPSKSCARRSPT